MRLLNVRDPRWWELVSSHLDALPFHHPCWSEVLGGAYGYRPFVLVSTDGRGALKAGVPVMEVKVPLRPAKWVALPFTDHCPVLGADGDLETALDDARREHGIASLELRAPAGGERFSLAQRGYRHVLALSRDPDEVFRRLHRSQVQRNIKRAEREGVVVRRAQSAADLDRYYALHLRTRRRLGTPVQPRRFFRLLWDRALEQRLGFILLAYLGATPVAGAVFLTWGETIVYKYGASDAGAWRHRPNHALFWQAIASAAVEGYRVVDFGRTEPGNEGLRSFKRGWATVEEPLIYSTAGEPARGTGRLLGPTLARVIRHSPLVVCRATGELAYRYVG